MRTLTHQDLNSGTPAPEPAYTLSHLFCFVISTPMPTPHLSGLSSSEGGNQPRVFLNSSRHYSGQDLLFQSTISLWNPNFSLTFDPAVSAGPWLCHQPAHDLSPSIGSMLTIGWSPVSCVASKVLGDPAPANLSSSTLPSHGSHHVDPWPCSACEGTCCPSDRPQVGRGARFAQGDWHKWQTKTQCSEWQDHPEKEKAFTGLRKAERES